MKIDAILEQIQRLSKQDTKTLSQKGLKLCEETGELAGVLLPYDNAAGTLHRFVIEQQILEESVDVILCAASILATINVSHEDIESVFTNKMSKWGKLQNNEKRVTEADVIPYEIHITVKATDGQLDMFRSVCEGLKIKPIVIDMECQNDTLRDVMASSTVFGNNRDATYEMLRITSSLETVGFIVTRKKIESVPWHPAAPQQGDDTMPNNCYFECHIPVVIHSDNIDRLRMTSNLFGLHISRNAFKQLDDGYQVIMATLRMRNTNHEHFMFHVNRAKKGLLSSGFQFTDERVAVEFTVYDTNVDHDSQWTKDQPKPHLVAPPTTYGKLCDHEDLYGDGEEE